MTDWKHRLEPLTRSEPDSGLDTHAHAQTIAAAASRLAGGFFAAALFFAPFRYRWTLFQIDLTPVYHDYTDGLVFISDIFLAAMLLAWLVRLAARPKRLTFGPLSLAIPLGGLLLASAISVPFSILPGLSMYHLARLGLYAGLYIYLANEAPKLRQFAPALAAGIFVQAAVGVAQWLEQADLGWQRLGEYELDPAWNGVSIVWAQTGRALRAYGLSDHPNILGGLLAFGLILLLAWYVSESQAGGPGRTLAAGVIILGLGGLLVTFSRSAWLAFASGVGLAALLLFRKRRKRLLLDGAALLMTALMVLAPLIWQALPYLGVRFNAGGSFEQVPYEQGSLVERAALNQAANAIFARHALTGVGLGAYPAALEQAEPDFIFNYQPPHLVILAAAAETGLFGALFYFLALTGPWLAVWLNRRRVALTPEQIGAVGLVLAVSVVGLFDYYPWLLAPGRFWAWLAWGLWAAAFPRSIPKD